MAPFVAGEQATGKMTYPGFEGYPFLAWVTAVDAPRRLAVEWTPGVDKPDVPETAPRTLVEFRLSTEADGTRLEIVEAGFDSLPEGMRESALRSNSGGWETQTENLRLYAEA